MIGSILGKLKTGLAKTRKVFTSDIMDLLRGARIDETILNRLEEILITADIGVNETIKIIEDIKKDYREGRLTNPSQIIDYLKNELKQTLGKTVNQNEVHYAPSGPTVILIAGVNGSGKTTSIAKLAHLFKQNHKSVLLSASDTFRAAAIEQLTTWAERLEVDIIKHQANSDPGAVAFDAAEASIKRKSDILIVDTAGRLHTKTNLMRELTKIKDVLARKIPGAPHETILVVDATTGQNAIAQAKLFNEAVSLTGLFLAKLDGTAKGGIIVAIKNQLNLPVKFIGVGEKIDDIEIFDAEKFVEALFEEPS
ncbi:MAG: signal recognition particle-docking protein FtsY [Planctomycetota bacterium]|nr:signal recognition particle-docking protein FtsY [Planctomycetota bacterium]MDI6788537.1 signal recognition particle-docking protein FtsY [Planctomycetota bacterium]